MLIFMAVFIAVHCVAETPALDPAMPYQAERSNPVTYDVDFSVVVTAPYKSKVLKVWLPIPQSDPGQEFTEGELTSFPMAVEPRIGAEKVFGNKFAYFEYKEPQGAQLIRHTFKIKVWELHWNLSADKIEAVKNFPDVFKPYLRGEAQAVVADERFASVLRARLCHSAAIP